MPRHATSCHIVSPHVTSCHVMSRHATSCRVMSGQAMSRHVASRHVTSRHFTSRYATLCHVISRHVTSRNVTSCHVMSRHITSRHDFFHTQLIQVRHNRVRWLSRRVPIPYRISSILSSVVCSLEEAENKITYLLTYYKSYIN